MAKNREEMMEKLVSVIIPAFNAQDFISQTIASVLSQTYKEIEMIIVDDGSIDTTYDICRSFAAQYPNIILLRHPGNKNMGTSFSRKLAIDHAKGKYIAFCDADDLMLPDKIERQVNFLKQYPGVILCHTALMAFGPDETFCRNLEKAMSISDKIFSYNLLNQKNRFSENKIANSTVMIYADVLKVVSFATDKLFQYEDWLLWIVLAQYGDFLYCPEKLTKYRFHPQSASAKMLLNPLCDLYARIELYLKLLIFLRPRKVLLKIELLLRIFYFLWLLTKVYASGIRRSTLKR